MVADARIGPLNKQGESTIMAFEDDEKWLLGPRDEDEDDFEEEDDEEYLDEDDDDYFDDDEDYDDEDDDDLYEDEDE